MGAMLIAAALAGCSKPEAEPKGPPKSEPQVGVVTLQPQNQQLAASFYDGGGAASGLGHH